MIIVLFALSTVACGGEPCEHMRTVDVPATETPFSDKSSVFSKCAACPELKDGPDAGPATLCSLYFGDSLGEANVACFYGPGGRTSWSGSTNAVHGVPNLFDYCKARCPDEDALHSCSITADANGSTEVHCRYGETCH